MGTAGMNNIRSMILPISAVVLVVTAGIVQGVMTNRWDKPRDLQPLAEQLQSIPATFGDWSATDLEVPADQLERGEIHAHLSRRYVNRKSGVAVNVLVVLGRPGPISVHTPDVCFRGAGYEQLASSQSHNDNIPGIGPSGFFVTSFAIPATNLPETVRVFWSWSTDGRWTAPENPRFQFAGKPFLLKLYATRSMHSRDEEIKDDE
jgi:hypothetical protein